jgi:hypothetical protein
MGLSRVPVVRRDRVGASIQFGVEGRESALRGNQITLRAPRGNGLSRGWVFGNPMTSYTTPITGALHRVRGGHTKNDLAVTMALISRWGGLAAKTQHGFGVAQVQLEDEQGEAVPYRLNDFLRFGETTSNDNGLPSLKNLFFAKIYFKDDIADDWWKKAELGTGEIQGGGDWPMFDQWRAFAPFSVPVAPAIKYKLRYGVTPAPASYIVAVRGRSTENFFFWGSRREESQGDA